MPVDIGEIGGQGLDLEPVNGDDRVPVVDQMMGECEPRRPQPRARPCVQHVAHAASGLSVGDGGGGSRPSSYWGGGGVAQLVRRGNLPRGPVQLPPSPPEMPPQIYGGDTQLVSRG